MKKEMKPTKEILKAFNAYENPVKLEGGQGETYKSGNIVLKPAVDNDETNFIANFYLSVTSDAFRLPKPILSFERKFVYKNWQAWEYMEGNHDFESWDEVIELCSNFHKAIENHPKPSYFDKREQNPWVIADKAVWDEIDLDFHPKIEQEVKKLKACLTPVKGRFQLIHGDFGGNVLFSKRLAPAIIDFSPYWRPVEFAIGVIVADAIVWEGAEFSLIDHCLRFKDFLQYLARAELRRIIELNTIFTIYGVNILDEINAHKKLINEIYNRISNKGI